MLLTTRSRTSPRINRFDVLRGIHLAKTLSRVALKLGISRVLATPPPPRAGGARAAERLRAATPVPGFQAARALAGRPGEAPLVAASMMLHGCRRAALPESARARPHLAVVTGASG